MPLFLYRSIYRIFGYKSIQAYTIIPTLKNPRWLFPFEKRNFTNAGKFVKPTSPKAKLAWKMALALSRFSLVNAVFPTTYFQISRVSRNFISDIHLKITQRKNETASFIFYTGAPGVFQKYCARFIDHKGNILYYAKISDDKKNKLRISNEFSTLKSLAVGNISDFLYPHATSYLTIDNYDVLVQTSIESVNSQFTSDLNSIHIKALCGLAHIGSQTTISLSGYIRDLNTAIHTNASHAGLSDILSVIDNCCADIIRASNQQPDSDIIQLILSHGDFTPWNVFIDKGICCIFDWELCKHRTPFWDIYNFILHSEVLIHQSDAIDICDKIDEQYSIFLDSYQTAVNGFQHIISPTLGLKLYLLDIIDYYLDFNVQNNNADIATEDGVFRLINIASTILKNQ
jgi:hypothetical protein